MEALSCYSFNETASLSQTLSGNLNRTLGLCGAGPYQTCCKVGDTCYQNGFCLHVANGGNSWYFGGCTDAMGEDASCPGFCPSGNGVLVWDTGSDEWKCCPSYPSNTDNLSYCVLPNSDYINNQDILYTLGPNSIQPTAKVLSTNLYSAIPVTAGALTNDYYYPYTTAPSYPSYTNSYYNPSYPSYTSSGISAQSETANPNECGDGSCDTGVGYRSASPVLVVVIVVPTICVLALITALICIVYRVRRKHKRNNPESQLNGAVPVGAQVNQHVMAGYSSPQETMEAYNRNITAMSWIAQQPPQPPQQQQQQGQVVTAEGQAPPLPARNPPDVPAEQSREAPSAAAPVLPPIQEASHTELEDVVAGAAVHPTSSSAEAASSSEPAGNNWPLASAAATSTEAPKSNDNEDQTPATDKKKNDEQADSQEGVGGAEQTDKPKSSTDEQRHNDDLYG